MILRCDDINAAAADVAVVVVVAPISKSVIEDEAAGVD